MKVLSMVLTLAAVGACGAPARAASEPPPGASSCSGCHAVNAAASSAVPKITGRDAAEILALMAAFRDGSRPSTVMGRLAKGFSDDELRPIAAWLADQK
jgi:sulfide dehydrogenase cytochrome subunit